MKRFSNELSNIKVTLSLAQEPELFVHDEEPYK